MIGCRPLRMKEWSPTQSWTSGRWPGSSVTKVHGDRVTTTVSGHLAPRHPHPIPCPPAGCGHLGLRPARTDGRHLSDSTEHGSSSGYLRGKTLKGLTTTATDKMTRQALKRKRCRRTGCPVLSPSSIDSTSGILATIGIVSQAIPANRGEPACKIFRSSCPAAGTAAICTLIPLFRTATRPPLMCAPYTAKGAMTSSV